MKRSRPESIFERRPPDVAKSFWQGHSHYSLATCSEFRRPPKGFSFADGSIPNVFLVPFDFVSLQQRAQLVLKPNPAVMLLLSGDVLLHLFEIRLAHRKIRVAALPLEVGVIA